MALFISYSSQDRLTVDALTNALRKAQQQVWFDQELGGGDSWWNKILEQIRQCDVFVVALSNNWLQSKPSQAELRYAQALHRPILPVRIGDIDSMRVNPLATLQIIDYREPTVDAGIQLVTAVHALQRNPAPLPDPLPDEPPVPFGYITRLGNTLAEKELSPQQQMQLLVELRSGLDEDGDDPSARGDIAQLLRMLRLRHDVTYRTRTEIDNVLAEIEAKDGPPGAHPAPAAEAATTAAKPSAPAAPSAAPATAPSSGGSNKRLLLIGGAVVAVIVAVAIVVVLATQGGKSKPASKAGPASTTSAPAGAANTNVTDAGRLDSYLVGAEDVGAIVGEPNLVVSEKASAMRSPRWALSNPDCLGAYEPMADAAYKGSGYTAVAGQAVHSPGEEPAHRIFESVVAFPSADKAGAFVQGSADRWKACAGQMVTTTYGGKTYGWKFDALDGTPPRIAQQRTQADGTRICHHVLRAASAVVIDVLLCGPDSEAGQAGRIAEQISAKVAQ
ncbi:sensor domain-containing protein [Mycobacterium sp. Marseille-P9652]|uniref:sensor domain-containing protein n=1 Tax=Mycobacterium sp. Marseille-P9652 TaxID=2654950 RepID=UPI0012E76743|nr:sensor domain-containing protein [Mycobacterium sp. Marseille-P9652]